MSRIRLVFLLCLAALVARAAGPKYIFLFIGDGMSTPQRMIAEEFARKTGHGELAINHMPYHATTRTASANSLVTDSAAAATAIACGVKTYNGAIGVDAEGNRVTSVAEVAKACGRKVGIITSVTINHATPAGFYAHRAQRGQLYGIGLDLVASNFDFFAGGGLAGHDDKKDDPQYQGPIPELAAKAGYTVVTDKEAFAALKPAEGGKYWGLFGRNALGYVINGPNDYPTLPELLAKGIELLQDAPEGFFIMTEGGAIDWVGHSNDAAPNLQELLNLDKTVQVALDFAKAHPNETLIVVTGDHETGGMSMGFAGTGYALYAERLANQKCDAGAFQNLVDAAQKEKPEMTFEEVIPLLREKFGFVFPGDEAAVADPKHPMLLKEAQVAELKEGFAQKKVGTRARKVMNDIAGVGWTSGSHTALPVLTTADGRDAEVFHGLIENTDISKKLKALMQP